MKNFRRLMKLDHSIRFDGFAWIVEIFESGTVCTGLSKDGVVADALLLHYLI